MEGVQKEGCLVNECARPSFSNGVVGPVRGNHSRQCECAEAITLTTASSEQPLGSVYTCL